MRDIKLCKDCKFCQPRIEGIFIKRKTYKYATCSHPDVLDGDGLVSGKSQKFCNNERTRAFKIINKCGSDARLFEAIQ